MGSFEANVVEFGSKYYKLKAGIPTGDPHGPHLADGYLGYLFKRLPSYYKPYFDSIEKFDGEYEKPKCLIKKRYLDDGKVYLYGKLEDVRHQVEMWRFWIKEKSGHNITVRIAGHPRFNIESKIEFLDTEIVCRNDDFYIHNYLKPTAKYATFLNYNSAHPRHTFPGIIKSQAGRIRRNNSLNSPEYLSDLENLRAQCDRSNFPKKLSTDILNKAIDLTRNLNYKTDSGPEQRTMNWVSKFSEPLKKVFKWPNWMGDNAKKRIRFTYSRPKTIGSFLTRSRQLCHGKPTQSEQNEHVTQECGKCLTCGNYALKKHPENKNRNMLWTEPFVYKSDGTRIRINESLNCSDSGIYVATCLLCLKEGKYSTYTGRTSGKTTKFSTRWSAHRRDFIKVQQDVSGDKKDAFALRRHVDEEHKNIRNPKMHEIYKVAFIQSIKTIKNIHEAENRWADRLGSIINLDSMITQEFK